MAKLSLTSRIPLADPIESWPVLRLILVDLPAYYYSTLVAVFGPVVVELSKEGTLNTESGAVLLAALEVDSSSLRDAFRQLAMAESFGLRCGRRLIGIHTPRRL